MVTDNQKFSKRLSKIIAINIKFLYKSYKCLDNKVKSDQFNTLFAGEYNLI